MWLAPQSGDSPSRLVALAHGPGDVGSAPGSVYVAAYVPAQKYFCKRVDFGRADRSTRIQTRFGK